MKYLKGSLLPPKKKCRVDETHLLFTIQLVKKKRPSQMFRIVGGRGKKKVYLPSPRGST